MIGFDRPLKPKWIYESLLLAQPGQKLTELNKPFEGIAKELTGKEGKRKARTVLFRCFLRDEEKQTRARMVNPLKDLSIEHGYEFMKPIYLFYLIGKTDSLINISDHIFRLYDFGSEINLLFLKQKMVNAFGERDVVSRAVGSFIKTLIHFDVIQSSEDKLIVNKRLVVNEEQTRIILQVYSKEILHAPQISLNHLLPALFNYFQMPDLKRLAQKHNGASWDYQHRTHDDLLIMH